MSTNIVKNVMKVENMLRSINIIYDADKPERIAHFYPTSKAVVLIDAVLFNQKEHAYLISAPYGSGKSLTATYLIHAVENTSDSKPVLKKINDKITETSKDVGRRLKERNSKDQKGIALALQGYVDDLSDSIEKALDQSLIRQGYDPFEIKFGLDFSDLNNTLSSLISLNSKDQKEKQFDRIVLLWDEFGRHLETLLAEGQPTRLNEIQVLAEFASRTIDLPFTIALMLHQSLLSYAGKSPQAIKKEWKKIEGRFELKQYIDDSKEIYRLISEIVYEMSEKVVKINEKQKNDALKEIKKLGIFVDFLEDELSELVEKSFPLHPVTLYLLPRLSSRVAQHERTLFTFLNSVNLKNPVEVDDLFDYFSSAMSGDTSIGGTYHQWLEAKSALTKVDTEIESKAVKTACLLGIGMSGERAKVSRSYLAIAVKGYSGLKKSVEETVDKLVSKKLFLYRKNSDSLSLWHGTDIDISSKLEEEKNRNFSSFDLIDFLMHIIEPISWKPIKYNIDHHIQRYFLGEYIDFERLQILLRDQIAHKTSLTLEADEDGRIYYFLPSSDEEKKSALNLVRQYGKHQQILWVIPEGHFDIFETALEVYCYLQLQSNAALIEADPLILPELQQLTDDATDYLQNLVEKAFLPGRKGPIILYQDDTVEIKSMESFRSYLSIIMNKVYSGTPLINNEMINRKNPRTTLINSRKKLIFAILDRSGSEDLMLEGYTPDVSMYRTILLSTGLYGKFVDDNENVIWKFRQPEELKDQGLKEVWSVFRSFFTQPKENQPFKFLFEEIKNPPYGVRQGIIPILFASALRAFPSSLSIKTVKGDYLEDVLPSTIEEICAKPESFLISVHELTDKRQSFLESLYKIFSAGEKVSNRETDILRQCYDAIEYWKSTLPDSAFTTRQISEVAQKIQDALVKDNDPEKLFFYKIPQILDTVDLDQLEQYIRKIKKEIEGIVELYYDAAKKSLLSAFQFSENGNLIKAAEKWTRYFPLDALDSFSDETAKAFLKRIRIGYDSWKQLVDSIAALLIGRSINRWDDSAITVFDRKVKDTVNHIEEYVLQASSGTSDAIYKNGLMSLAHERIRFLYRKLINISSKEEADKILSQIKEEV